MFGASSVRSIMSKSIWVLVLALCAAPLASAEIFKCVGKNGTDLYQNFPCQFDSLGSSRAADLPVDVASNAKSAKASEPRIGMTPDEVRALWGEPVETIEDEQRQGRIEIWRYGESRSVQFNHKHRVIAVQR
jgi:hypothetical protein